VVVAKIDGETATILFSLLGVRDVVAVALLANVTALALVVVEKSWVLLLLDKKGGGRGV